MGSPSFRRQTPFERGVMRDSEEKAGKKGEKRERPRCGTGVGEAREGRAWAGEPSYSSTNTYYSTNITYLTI